MDSKHIKIRLILYNSFEKEGKKTLFIKDHIRYYCTLSWALATTNTKLGTRPTTHTKLGTRHNSH